MPKFDYVRSLADIPGLEQMSNIAMDCGVDIHAYGSLLTNLALLHGPETPFIRDNNHVFLPRDADLKKHYSLFDLVPFTSDIDLVHSGQDAQTQPIRRAILESIPCAECFRWQIISRHQNEERLQSLRCSSIIPSKLLGLSTLERSGIHDPWNGINDILHRSFRFIRNGFFSESPLFRGNRDLEVFSALLYLRLLVQTDVPDPTRQPGFSDARDVFADALRSPEDMRRLDETDYLRARLLYLLNSLWCSSRVSQENLRSLIDACGYEWHHYVRYYREHIELVPSGPPSRLISSWLGGNRFRCATHQAGAIPIVAEGGPYLLQNIFNRLPAVHYSPATDTDFELSDHLVPIFQSEPIPIVAGQAICSQRNKTGKLITQKMPEESRIDEFLHWAVKLNLGKFEYSEEWVEKHAKARQLLSTFAEEDISCIVYIEYPKLGHGTVIPSPTIARFSATDPTTADWLHLRINCFEALQELSTPVPSLQRQSIPIGETEVEKHIPVVRLLVVGWTSPFSADAQRN